MSKKQGQHVHAKKRALERYGLSYNRIVRKEIIKQIQNRQNARFLEKKTNRIVIWLVRHNEIEYKIAYDKHRKNIASFLPLEAKEEQYQY